MNQLFKVYIMSLLKINKKLIKVANNLLKLKKANDNKEAIQIKMNKLTQAINSGKLSSTGLEQAGKMLIQLTNQLINIQ